MKRKKLLGVEGYFVPAVKLLFQKQQQGLFPITVEMTVFKDYEDDRFAAWEPRKRPIQYEVLEKFLQKYYQEASALVECGGCGICRDLYQELSFPLICDPQEGKVYPCYLRKIAIPSAVDRKIGPLEIPFSVYLENSKEKLIEKTRKIIAELLEVKQKVLQEKLNEALKEKIFKKSFIIEPVASSQRAKRKRSLRSL